MLMHPYPDGITGKELEQLFTRKEKTHGLKNALALAFFTLFFGALTVEIVSKAGQSYFFVFTVPAWILCFYQPYKAMNRHLRNVRRIASGELFFPYGTPEEIAAVLSDPENVQVLDSKRILLTKDYLMEKDEFLTYIPLREICRVHLTMSVGRRDRRIVLKVQKQTMEICCYLFEAGPVFSFAETRMERIAEIITMHMASYAPDCEVTLGG